MSCMLLIHLNLLFDGNLIHIYTHLQYFYTQLQQFIFNKNQSDFFQKQLFSLEHYRKEQN